MTHDSRCWKLYKLHLHGLKNYPLLIQDKHISTWPAIQICPHTQMYMQMHMHMLMHMHMHTHAYVCAIAQHTHNHNIIHIKRWHQSKHRVNFNQLKKTMLNELLLVNNICLLSYWYSACWYKNIIWIFIIFLIDFWILFDRCLVIARAWQPIWGHPQARRYMRNSKKKKWKGCNKEHAVREKVIRVSGLVLYGWGTWGDKMWHIEGNKMHNLFYYCLNWNAHI